MRMLTRVCQTKNVSATNNKQLDRFLADNAVTRRKYQSKFVR
jgi:hypothetical protein